MKSIATCVYPLGGDFIQIIFHGTIYWSSSRLRSLFCEFPTKHSDRTTCQVKLHLNRDIPCTDSSEFV